MNKIVIISNPVPASNQSSKVSLSKLIRLAEAITDDLTVIAGNIDGIEHSERTSIVSFPREKKNKKLLNCLCYLRFQCKCFVSALKTIKKDSKVLFWIADSMPLCMLAAKIKRADTYYFIYGNISKIDKGMTGKITSGAVKMMARTATYVCAEDDAVFNEWESEFNDKDKKIIHLYSEFVMDMTLLRSPKNKIAGMICRISGGKHVQEVIEAFCMFYNHHSEWKLEIAGNGEQYNECVGLIQKEHAEGYIKMLGWVPHEQLPEIVSDWAFAVAPSDSEGLPNTIIECMSLGVPCLASPVGAIPSIISDEKNGWLLKSTDKDTIYQAMCDIEETEIEQMLAIRSAARDTIYKRYSFIVAKTNLQKQL